ncbi:tyrosine-protein phosphatase non-receptor type substrate 1-like [Numida meleagris]|uniref:tyrosine-protein phosphatase non-receptor type substrate 1-like n=1 Tax=Numida meleagris TaxID=8996 RepID=UPI000B3D977B|nr:tyrosine-protein phosphatase non-receptor type substrate 1-like [Numida meleagris]
MALTMTLELQALLLTCLVLLLHQKDPGAGAQKYPDFKLQQSQGPVVMATGETLTLNCTVSGLGPIGPVKWLKGSGSSSQTFYDLKGPFPPRVTRAVDESNTDFTIHIRDVRLEDAGTYYCVKFIKVIDGEEVFKSGEGTEVSVHARPSEPVMSGPSRRAVPGQSVPFTCSAAGFFPRDIQVKWLKNSVSVQAEPPNITPELSRSSYNMSSTIQVTLREDDIRSELTCEVQHITLADPLRRTYALRQALRVPPNVSVVAAPPGAVEVNKTVNFTCHVRGFYPGPATVTWLENGTETNAGSTTRPRETSRGLYELKSTVTVQAGEEKNGSRFTCRVVLKNLKPISSTGTLRIAAPAQWGPSDSCTGDNSAILLSSPGIWLGLLLEKVLLAIVLFFLFKRSRP